MNLSSAPFRVLLAAAFVAPCLAADLRITTDFEGASARVESIEQTTRTVRVMPGGDPQRGWPCWWYFRLDGVEKGESAIIDLAGSDRPARNNGKDTGKPLDSNWAMPTRAVVSSDGVSWQHTAPGLKEKGRIRYEVTGTGGPLWVAWGPPFTPAHTDALISQMESALPSAKGFELARTREGRPVRGLRVAGQENAQPRHRVWIQARLHAWESGASWVARGFAEWLVSEDGDARWLRENAAVVIIPIMDVDNAATGNGGKEAAPRDHNRDWNETPEYPEIAAAQAHLREWDKAGGVDAFLDLHNPGPGDMRPFFFACPEEIMAESGRARRNKFFDAARKRISGPLALEEKVRITGIGYHPLWKQMSGIWVTEHMNRKGFSACLETAWNTPQSTTENYMTVGRQLGQALVESLMEE